jgi:hypothetical protein
VCGFAAVFGSPPASSQKPQRPNQYVYKNGCPLLPLQHSKNRTDAASKASCEQSLRSAGQKGKFFRRQKFALLLKNTKTNDAKGGWNYLSCLFVQF